MIDRSGDDFSYRWSEAEPALRRVLAARIRNPADRDDVVQEAALVAWSRRDCYDTARPFGAWAYGIARRCVGGLRQARTVSLDDAVLRRDAGADQVHEAREHFDRALANLGPDDRALLLWAHADRLTLAQIGSRIGRSTRIAALRLRRAEDRLRRGVAREATAAIIRMA